MPKSNYPNKLDTSVEIPAVRDNIVEIGSDVLNSLRSAIFQIEKTLGLNPQGAAGNTVASRLNAALDGNGNILKEALDKAGLISGPITNEDISKNAGIDESKLKLRFPTDLLQDEVSQLLLKVDNLIAAINEINSILSAHINTAAINRHKALSISVDAIDETSSSEGIISLQDSSLQQVLQDILAKHINYDGSNISATNRSHEANQVFFDNTGISTNIPSSDVQGAIEDVLGLVGNQTEIHQYKFHENGLIRRQKNLDSSNLNTEGLLLLADEPVSYNFSNPNLASYTSNVIFPNTPAYPSVGIQVGDIVEITSNGISTKYQIADVNQVSGNITSITIFGSFTNSSNPAAIASIYRNPNRIANLAGLMVGTREFYSVYGTSFSNADIVQVASPNATHIVSNQINPSAINTLSKLINVSVDGGSSISFDLYEPSESLQTLDSVIKRFNQQVAAYGLSILAYRLDLENGQSEMAIVHDLPNSSSENHTITLSSGTSGTALSDLGFGSVDGVEIFTGVGTEFVIQGVPFSNLGSKLETSDFILTSGTASITTSQLDFTDFGIKKGDLVSIYGTPSDDGTYVVKNVTSTDIIIDANQLQSGVWSGISDSNSILRVLDRTISFENLQFSATISGASKSSVIDLFLDSDLRLNYNKVFDYSQSSYAATNLVCITDYDGEPSVYTESNPGSIKLELISGKVFASLDDGPAVNISEVIKNNLVLYSGKFALKLSIFINSKFNIAAKLATSPLNTEYVDIVGYQQVSYKENIPLGRVSYESLTSRITGAGLPKIIPITRRGTIGIEDVGTDVIHELQQRPIYETRSNGVIFGLEVSVPNTPFDGSNYLINISSGVCYVKGKRFEINQKVSLNTGLSNSDDNIFIAINEFGEILFRPPTSIACESPFNPYNYCLLGRLEYNAVVVTPVDLRLFIDNLDLKVLNSITVSPQPGIGHFTSVAKALRYAARFSEIFPQAGIPKVHLKSGTYKIDLDFDSNFDVSNLTKFERSNLDGIWINFPVILEGEGDSTVLDLSKSYADYPITSDDRLTAAGNIIPNNAFGIQIAGPGLTTVPPTNVGVLTAGTVKIKDIRFRMSHVEILDPLTEDGSGNKLDYEVVIENCTFDYSENPNPGTGRRAVILSSINSTPATDQFGNIKVIGCNFLNSNIRIQDFLAANARNMTFANNSSRLPGAETAFVTTNTSGHIFDAVGALPEANISFIGNQLSNNASIDGAYLDSTGALPWGDRVSRMLTVGGALGVGTSTDIGKNTAGRHRLAVGDSNDGFANRILLANDGNSDLELLTNSGGTQTLSLGYDQSANRVSINYGDLSQGHIQIASTGDVRIDGTVGAGSETNSLYFGSGTQSIKKNTSNELEITGRLKIPNGLVTVASELSQVSLITPNTTSGLVYTSTNRVVNTYSNEIFGRIGNGSPSVLVLNLPSVMQAKVISIFILASDNNNDWYPPDLSEPDYGYYFNYDDVLNLIRIEFTGTNFPADSTVNLKLFINYYTI